MSTLFNCQYYRIWGKFIIPSVSLHFHRFRLRPLYFSCWKERYLHSAHEIIFPGLQESFLLCLVNTSWLQNKTWKCPSKPFFLVTAPKLNYFGTFQRVACIQVVCMWPRHPVVNAFIYFSPSCFLSANDESALTLRRHLRPAVPLSLSLLRHQHTVVVVCTVRFALLPSPTI